MRSVQVPALLKNLIIEVTIEESIPLDAVSCSVPKVTSQLPGEEVQYSKGHERLQVTDFKCITKVHKQRS